MVSSTRTGWFLPSTLLQADLSLAIESGRVIEVIGMLMSRQRPMSAHGGTKTPEKDTFVQ